MHIDGEIKSNRMIKQRLEQLENQVRDYPLNELIHSLREYLYEAPHDQRKVDPTNGVISTESFWRISFWMPLDYIHCDFSKRFAKEQPLKKAR